MNELIAANRRRSALLLFLLVIVLTIIGAVVGYAMAPGIGGVIVGVLIAGVILLVQLWIYRYSPSSIVMAGMGGRKIEKAECPRLFNVVEEMQLASGLKTMPHVWLIDSPAPNAFAYSDGRGNASVACTTGLLWRLNRDELQGVMAHEVGHIVNRDVQFITFAGVVLGSIVVLADLAGRMLVYGPRTSSRSSSRSSDNGGFAIVIFVVALLVMILGPLLGQLLYFAISRKREYLADASATLFTRYPEGLASALEKIEAHANGMPSNRVANAMCIINPEMAAQAAAGSGGSKLLSTHPPTAQRISILRGMGNSTGLAAYEAAYRGATLGGAIGVGRMGGPSNTEAARAPSGEGPIMDRPALRDAAQAAAGFLVIACSCGMEIRIPPRYERPTIRCIRCSTNHDVAAADAVAVAVADAPAGTNRRPPSPDPISIPRPTPGQWNSIPCQCCGNVSQVSPEFAASRLRCVKCGQVYNFS